MPINGKGLCLSNYLARFGHSLTDIHKDKEHDWSILNTLSHHRYYAIYVSVYPPSSPFMETDESLK